MVTVSRRGLNGGVPPGKAVDVSAWQALDIQTRFSINVYVHRGRKPSLRQGLILAASLSLYFHSSLLHTADTIGCSTDAHDRHPFWNIEGNNSVF